MAISNSSIQTHWKHHSMLKLRGNLVHVQRYKVHIPLPISEDSSCPIVKAVSNVLCWTRPEWEFYISSVGYEILLQESDKCDNVTQMCRFSLEFAKRKTVAGEAFK